MLATMWLKHCYINGIIMRLTIQSLKYASWTRLRKFISYCVYQDMLIPTHTLAHPYRHRHAKFEPKVNKKKTNYFLTWQFGEIITVLHLRNIYKGFMSQYWQRYLLLIFSLEVMTWIINISMIMKVLLKISKTEMLIT